MLPRTVAAALVLAATLAVTACQPEPEPTPTGPAFASEDEAFAAAEQTYRAYVDALNQVDLSDPATFEPVYAWTTGELNASDRKNFSAWHADDYTKTGLAKVAAVQGREADHLESAVPSVTLDVCYDVSSVDVLDRDGVSIVSADRPATQELEIKLETSQSPTGLSVSAITGAESSLSC